MSTLLGPARDSPHSRPRQPAAVVVVVEAIQMAQPVDTSLRASRVATAQEEQEEQEEHRPTEQEEHRPTGLTAQEEVTHMHKPLPSWLTHGPRISM